MKISNKTLSLLQSFAQISSNLLVKPGKKLATRNAVNSIQARAVVDETFPQQFAIYDLNQLLSLISASQNPDIEFGDKSLVIRSENGGEVEYFYADESLVTAPNEAPPQLEDIYSFKVTSSDIQTVIKTASIISATTLNIVSEKGKVTMTINDPKNTTSHSYKKPLGDAEASFNVKMAIDSFKVVPDEYTVRVANAVAKAGKVVVFFFESTSSDLTYLIAADATSKV
jgi:hypothetical protein